jgi:dual specificity tyrosine-phosphorylation-regulated kinase 2/3/4
LACIAEVLGNPPQHMVESCNRKDKLFDEKNQLIVNKSPKGLERSISSKTFEKLINARNKDKKFVSFLQKCLNWDPKLRLTPTNALNHPFIKDEIIYNNNKNELSSKSKHGVINFDDELPFCDEI